MGIKYKVNEDFFKIWNPTMAYVLGYWYADGSLEDASYLRGKYIRVTSTDFDTILKIKKWLSSAHTIVVSEPTKLHPGKTRYLLRIGSHMLYDDLAKLGLYPRKSLTIKFPEIPQLYVSDFIRGYFDGDGCVYLELKNESNYPKRPKRLSVIFTSGSLDFLKSLCSILAEKADTKQLNIYKYKEKHAFQLRYFTKDSIKVFEFLYQGCPNDMFLPRKLEVFKRYYALRPSRMSNASRDILDPLSGHVAKEIRDGLQNRHMRVRIPPWPHT